METVKLGRTGLEVSVVGLGAGGTSQLGLGKGGSEAHAIDLVHAGLDLGITLIDTATAYGNEAVIGKALEGRREGVVISTKVRPTRAGSPWDGEEFVSRKELRDSIEASLRALRTDRIDIMHLHGVGPNQYAHYRQEFVPELLALRNAGKIRFLGITERFGIDLDHAVLQKVIQDGVFDVLMLGMNIATPSVRTNVLPAAIEKNLGTMCMYAVRGALARNETVVALVEALIRKGEVDPVGIDRSAPLGFLLADGGARSLTDAAYRFCRHIPGIHVVMTGTASLEHLKENVASIQAPPLPPAALERLARMFGRAKSATGDL